MRHEHAAYIHHFLSVRVFGGRIEGRKLGTLISLRMVGSKQEDSMRGM